MFTLINPWAVLVATFVGYMIGWAWYSPVLWLKPWMAARGDTGPSWMKKGNTERPRVMFYGLVNTFAVVFTIAVFLALTNVQSLIESLQVALLLCFGLTITLKFNEMLYTARPPHWGKNAQLLFLIDSGYQIALFVAAATVLWYMH